MGESIMTWQKSKKQRKLALKRRAELDARPLNKFYRKASGQSGPALIWLITFSVFSAPVGLLAHALARLGTEALGVTQHLVAIDAAVVLVALAIWGYIWVTQDWKK